MCCNCIASLFRRSVVPRFVHSACRMEAFAEMRRRIVPKAVGAVVEVGIGSGHNLPHYDPARVTRVTGIDPDMTMLDLAQPRCREFAPPLELIAAAAEDMPLADGSADTVVVTYAFCTIPDVGRALAEIRRVLKPDGRLLFVEHACSDRPFRRKWQDRLDRAWGQVAGGCHLNRDPERSLTAAGFEISDATRTPFTGMLWHLGTHISGMAAPVG